MDESLDLLTVEEVAEILKVHRKTVWLRIKAKKIPAVKIGKYWMISRQDLIDYIYKKDPG